MERKLMQIYSKNETILATRQELFITKVALVQSIIPSQKISEILPLYSGIMKVLSNKQWELVFFSRSTLEFIFSNATLTNSW